MNLKNIALLNIRRRKSKALFILAGLTIGVSTMVALVGLSEALTTEINHKLEKYGANIIITPRTEELSLSYEGMSLGGVSVKTGELLEEDLKRIRTIKYSSNLAAVGPMILGPIRLEDRDVLLAGVDFKAAETLKPWWKIDGERPDADGLLLGSEAARVLGLKTGEIVLIDGREMTVSGVLDPTGSQDDQLAFTTLASAQALLHKEGLVSMVEVAALCIHCPVEEMVDQIGGVLPGAKVTAIGSVVKGRMETLSHFKKFSYGISAVVFLVGSLLVFVTMMGGVRERISEIGIFRAIGFRRGHIVRIILFEAALISMTAGILGYGLGFLAGEITLPFLAESVEAHVPFIPLLAVGSVMVALILGLLAGLHPALTAARLDPHEALRTI